MRHLIAVAILLAGVVACTDAEPTPTPLEIAPAPTPTPRPTPTPTATPALLTVDEYAAICGPILVDFRQTGIYWLDFASFAYDAQETFSELLPPPELEDFHVDMKNFIRATRRVANTRNLDAPYSPTRLFAEYEVRAAIAARDATVEEMSVAIREALERERCE